MDRADVVDGGLRSLDWLVSLQLSSEGDFAPIGCNGFLARGGAAAAFDQQPVEACTVASACRTAFGVSGSSCWMRSRIGEVTRISVPPGPTTVSTDGGDSWICGPETADEREGDVGYVTFPCGYTLDADGDGAQ